MEAVVKINQEISSPVTGPRVEILLQTSLDLNRFMRTSEPELMGPILGTLKKLNKLILKEGMSVNT